MSTSFQFFRKSVYICSSLLSRVLHFKLGFRKEYSAWELNDVLNETKVMKDWRSQGISFPNIEEVQDVEEKALATIGAPLLHTTKEAVYLPDVSTYNINSPNLRLCSRGEWREVTHLPIQKPQLTILSFKVISRVYYITQSSPYWILMSRASQNL